MDYKKILEGVVDIINTTKKSDIGFANICAYIGENCPEIKESEDERVRKKVIDVLKLNVRGAESQMQASRGVDRTFEIHACNKVIDLLEKQGKQKPNPYSGISFEYNGHTWGMCARDGGVEILIDGHLKGRVFTNDSNAKEMFIKALERVEEQNSKGYKLTDCDKNSWWEDFKAYTSCTFEQEPVLSEEDENWLIDAINVCELHGYDETAGWLKNRLKSLRPQNEWKPSEEQMDSIDCAVRKMKESACYDSELVSLFNDLKKLKEGKL